MTKSLDKEEIEDGIEQSWGYNKRKPLHSIYNQFPS